MNILKKFLQQASRVALISIHPEYAEKIVSGEKRVEFRRGWAAQSIDFLVVYATTPVKKIVAIIEVGNVHRGSSAELWQYAKEYGGGITREALFSYMEGKQEGVAIEIKSKIHFDAGISPSSVLGEEFRAPQFFRYLHPHEVAALENKAQGRLWE